MILDVHHYSVTMTTVSHWTRNYIDNGVLWAAKLRLKQHCFKNNTLYRYERKRNCSICQTDGTHTFMPLIRLIGLLCQTHINNHSTPKSQLESDSERLNRLLTWTDWIGLSSVLRPQQHSIGYMGDGFTGQKTQPTVSKYWRYNSTQRNQTYNNQTINTKHSKSPSLQ